MSVSRLRPPRLAGRAASDALRAKRLKEDRAQPPKARQGAVLVGAGEPAVADHVGRQDRGKLPAFGHGVASVPDESITKL